MEQKSSSWWPLTLPESIAQFVVTIIVVFVFTRYGFLYGAVTVVVLGGLLGMAIRQIRAKRFRDGR